MKTKRVRNDDLLLRMVRMRMNGDNLMYKDGVPRDWIIATIQSWGQGLEDGDVDNAIREGILVDAGKNLIGQQIYKPAEYLIDKKAEMTDIPNYAKCLRAAKKMSAKNGMNAENLADWLVKKL